VCVWFVYIKGAKHKCPSWFVLQVCVGQLTVFLNMIWSSCFSRHAIVFFESMDDCMKYLGSVEKYMAFYGLLTRNKENQPFTRDSERSKTAQQAFPCVSQSFWINQFSQSFCSTKQLIIYTFKMSYLYIHVHIIFTRFTAYLNLYLLQQVYSYSQL